MWISPLMAVLLLIITITYGRGIILFNLVPIALWTIAPLLAFKISIILHEDEEFTRKLRISPEEVAQKLKSMSEKYGDLRVQEKIDEIQEKFKHIKRKTFVHRRLLNAFPNMRSAGSQRRDMHFQYIKKILKEKR